MKLKRVAITGADNSIRASDLVELSQQSPFVEWAILLSKSSEGMKPRYPSRDWIVELKKVAQDHNLRLAGHICGSWVRDLIMQKRFSFLEDRPEFEGMFARYQLNFSPYHTGQAFLDVLPQGPQYIFQMGSKWKSEKEQTLRLGLDKGMNLAVLFDRSGGKGVTPEFWPAPMEGVYCGYAGGLGPDTLAEQLPLIADAVGESTIWIDMERRVRSNDDTKFDLEKVRSCLDLARPWVGGNIEA